MFLYSDGWQAKPNELLRFTLTGAEEELVDQSEAAAGLRGVVQGLRFDKRCSKLRPMADTWSKVKKNGLDYIVQRRKGTKQSRLRMVA